MISEPVDISRVVSYSVDSYQLKRVRKPALVREWDGVTRFQPHDGPTSRSCRESPVCLVQGKNQLMGILDNDWSQHYTFVLGTRSTQPWTRASGGCHTTFSCASVRPRRFHSKTTAWVNLFFKTSMILPRILHETMSARELARSGLQGRS